VVKGKGFYRIVGISQFGFVEIIDYPSVVAAAFLPYKLYLGNPVVTRIKLQQYLVIPVDHALVGLLGIIVVESPWVELRVGERCKCAVFPIQISPSIGEMYHNVLDEVFLL